MIIINSLHFLVFQGKFTISPQYNFFLGGGGIFGKFSVFFQVFPVQQNWFLCFREDGYHHKNKGFFETASINQYK